MARQMARSASAEVPRACPSHITQKMAQTMNPAESPILALCTLLAAAFTYGSAPSPMPTVYSDCPKYYDGACSEAIGRWLPTFGIASDRWAQAKRVHQRDGFIYENERPRVPDALGFQGPDDGSFFVYGNAGPPKGHVVYDPKHHVAFYQQGCCSWDDVVAASDVSSPPKHLVSRDLSGLRTVRGIRLGMRPSDVIRIYGSSNLLSVARHDGVSLLAYTTWPPKRSLKSVEEPCGQFENFFFRHDHLVLIQLGNGC